MTDADEAGLRVRLDVAERQLLAWKETALTRTKEATAANERLTQTLFERNLLRRERKAISLVIRNVVDNGGDVAELLDLLASLAQPLREGEGLLVEEGTDDG